MLPQAFVRFRFPAINAIKMVAVQTSEVQGTLTPINYTAH
jgi:hypothetical protein